MTALTKASSEAETRLEELTLAVLFKEAEKLGSVYIHSSEDNPSPECYHAKIKFRAAAGFSVEARSNFRMEIHEALIIAIRRASDLASQMGMRGDT